MPYYPPRSTGSSATGDKIVSGNFTASANSSSHLVSFISGSTEMAYVTYSGTMGMADATASTDGVNVRTLTRAGFIDRTSSAMTFNTGTRVFTIGPTGSSFQYWTNNTRYTVTVSQSVTIGTGSGEWFVYFNSAGTLVSSTSPWDPSSDQAAPVSLIYWDGGSKGAFGEERHSAYRDRGNHRYLHNTRGAAYDNGLTLTFTNVGMTASAGTIWDEDIKVDITASMTGTRLYRRVSGTAGLSMSFTDNALPYAGTTSQPQYDNSGTLSNVGNTNYVMNWYYATDEFYYPIACVVGQATYTTLANARLDPQPNFPNRTTREWKLLYSALWRLTGGATTFIESTDYRTVSNLPGAAAPTTLPAGSVTYIPTAPLTGVTVQSALDQIAAGGVRPVAIVSGAFTASMNTYGNIMSVTSGTSVAMAVVSSGILSSPSSTLVMQGLGATSTSSVSVVGGPWGAPISSVTQNTTPNFSPASKGVLLASILGDAGAASAPQVTSVIWSGGTPANATIWQKACGGNAAGYDDGVAEFWWAYTDTAQTNVAVEANTDQAVNFALSVVLLSGANTTNPVGVTVGTYYLTGTDITSSFSGLTSGSMLFSNGFPYNYVAPSSYDAGTTLVDAQNGVAIFVRSTSAVSGTSQTIGWNYASPQVNGGTVLGLEILPASLPGTSNIIRSTTTLAASGSKILSIQNNATEKAYVDMDGGGYFGAPTTVSGTLLLTPGDLDASWKLGSSSLSNYDSTYFFVSPENDFAEYYFRNSRPRFYVIQKNSSTSAAEIGVIGKSGTRCYLSINEEQVASLGYPAARAEIGSLQIYQDADVNAMWNQCQLVQSSTYWLGFWGDSVAAASDAPLAGVNGLGGYTASGSYMGVQHGNTNNSTETTKFIVGCESGSAGPTNIVFRPLRYTSNVWVPDKINVSGSMVVSGSVGIGTTDPLGYKLRVNGTSLFDDVIYGGGGTYSFTTLPQNSTNAGIKIRVLNTNAPLDALSISYLGYVGIGTMAPGTNFDVNGSIYCTGSVKISSSNSQAYLRFTGTVSDNYIGPSANNGLMSSITDGEFVINASKAFRICSNGASTPQFTLSSSYVGIGTASPTTRLEVTGGVAMTSGWHRTMVLSDTFPGLIFNSNNTNWACINYDYSSKLVVRMSATTSDVFGSGKEVLSFVANGNATFPYYVSGADFVVTSDARLKSDVKTIYNALETVAQLRGVTFVKSGEDKSRKMGLIAQEVRQLVPEVVGEADDGMLNVSYGSLAGLFIEAIKDLKMENDELKKRLSDIERRMG